MSPSSHAILASAPPLPAADDAIGQFIEQIGMSAQIDGLPRIAGRIAGYFIIHGGPVSFAHLATELKVSRGSISTNVRMLTAIGLIERVSMPGDRQDYFQIASSPFLRMIDGHLERLRRVRRIVEEASHSIPAMRPDTRARLEEMNSFYREAVKSNEQLLERLSKDAP